MSNDLISRKAVLDLLTEECVINSILSSPAFAEMVVQRVKKLPTAFDKEKVKQELEIASKLYRISEKDSEFAIPQNIAFELIEKGGSVC